MLIKRLSIDIVRAHDPKMAETFDAIASRQWSDEVEAMISVAAKSKAKMQDDPEEGKTRR